MKKKLIKKKVYLKKAKFNLFKIYVTFWLLFLQIQI